MTVLERTLTFEVAVANGWRFIGVFGDEKTPNWLHCKFSSEGCEVADCPFDGNGERVKRTRNGLYALWVNPCGIAKCGCVYHAEEGRACEHDIVELEKLIKKIIT